ncbi:MAG TPA: RDD family protein [Burkholderiales bacterium]|nr:RDD family protein [Burkholderiales bacterium]
MENSSSSSPEAALRSTVEYVGFWRRFLAFVIDSLIVLVVLVPLAYFAHKASDWARLGEYMQHAMEQAAAGERPDVVGSVSALGFSGPLDVLIQIVLPIAALFLFWKFRSATPGKMAVGAKIVDAKSGKEPTNWQLFIRFIGYFISIVPLGLGFLWIAFDRKKRGWHDLIAGTVVVYED